MSRRALWRPAAPVANGQEEAGPGGPRPSAQPTGALPTSRAVSRHVGAGVGTPEIATSADIRAQGVARGDVGAILARIADLHEQLAQAHRDLSGKFQNQLDGCADSRLMSDVETTSKRPRLMSIQDIAERLQLDARTVRRMRTRGQLPPAIDLHSVLRWEEAAIEAWLEERRER